MGGLERSGPDCRPFVGGLPFVGNVRPAGATPCTVGSTPPPDVFNETVASNVESLRTYLETSAPQFTAQVAPDRLRLTIRPNSMSTLRVETLAIGGDPGRRPVHVDVTEVQVARETRVVESHPAAVRADGMLDFGSALADARFFTGLDLTRSAPPTPRVNVRWIAGLEEAQRQRLERYLGLQNGGYRATRTWNYDLADASRARIGEIVANDAVEDTHGINRVDLTLSNPDPYRPYRLVRAPRLYELVFSFSRPLPGLQSETIVLSFVNTVTGEEVEGLRVPAVEAPARGSPFLGERLCRRDRRFRGLGGVACGAVPPPYRSSRDHAWRGAPTTSRRISSFHPVTTWLSRVARTFDSVPASSCWCAAD